MVSGVILRIGYSTGNRKLSSRIRECIVKFNGCNSASEAAKLIGRRAIAIFKRKKYLGKIVRTHGNNGAVIVKFKKTPPTEHFSEIVLEAI
ncbi:MAG: 50S ribosomal protein L35ae [Candidatus Methanomethylicia archaeon]